MKGKSAGRFTILTPQMIDDFVVMIKAGATFKMAINAMSIGERTFYLWLSKGEDVLEKVEAASEKGEKYIFGDNEELYLQFMQSIKRAEADAMRRNVAIIQAAAKKSWQAAAWYLERRDPEEFGRKYRLEHTGDKDNPVYLTYEERMKERRKERELGDDLTKESSQSTLNLADKEPTDIDVDKDIEQVSEKSFLAKVKSKKK
jgi:hypothetical protein